MNSEIDIPFNFLNKYYSMYTLLILFLLVNLNNLYTKLIGNKFS